jgi:hypothetical protein
MISKYKNRVTHSTKSIGSWGLIYQFPTCPEDGLLGSNGVPGVPGFRKKAWMSQGRTSLNGTCDMHLLYIHACIYIYIFIINDIQSQ